jgi:hypothetical protein
VEKEVIGYLRVVFKRLVLIYFLLVLGYVFYYIFIGDPIRGIHDVAVSDFVAFLTGGRMIALGLGGRLYDLGYQYGVQRALVAPEELIGLTPFRNPPFVALAFVPFIGLYFVVGYQLFAAVNMVLLAQGTYLLGLLFPGIKKVSYWKVIPITSLFGLSILAIGQLSPVVFLGVLGTYLFLKRKKHISAGLAAALLTVKPQFLILFPFLIFLSAQKKRFVSGSLLLGCLLAGVSLMISGADFLPSYISFLLHTEDVVFASDPREMFSLFALLRRLGVVGLEGYLINFIGYFLVLGAFWHKASKSKLSFDTGFIVAVLFTLVFAVHVYAQDLVWLLVPMFYLLSKATTSWKTWSVVAVLYFLPALDVVGMAPFGSIFLLVLGIMLW